MGGVYTSGTIAAQMGVNFCQSRVAQCGREPTLHALFSQAAPVQCPIKALVLFTLDRFQLPVFGPRANREE